MRRDDGEWMRELTTRELSADLIVVGGGLAGTCTAITAARQGIRVVLVQDRPVLGGNSSSEVRLWTLGATSHMGNNNRWAREGGVIDEILVENMYRNREGNPLIFDTVLLEKVTNEPNITLLLNTAVYEVDKDENGSTCLKSVTAFCSQNSTRYHLSAPLFVDASGDGIVGFLSGAAFRMGAESEAEFGEKFAPSQEYGELLGHSLYFYSKDLGRPVKYVPPAYALTDIEDKIPRFRSFNTKDFGCRLWWIEWGGRLDTVHETETIKWELWKVVYGVWDYIKNSGKFPEAETLTLEWVGHIPGKRESRRFEGDYILRQQDLICQTHFEDAVAFGGWSIDLHPADGVFSEKPGCTQWHSKGTYQIPYRSLYSRDVANLFLAGRIISASHVAFGSTRVMATCAHAGQAVGIAAALATHNHLLPREVPITEIQRDLLRTGQHIPGYRLSDPDDIAPRAAISASSTFTLSELPADGPLFPLKRPAAQMVPTAPGPVPTVTVRVNVAERTELRTELRISSRPDNHTPDVVLAERTVALEPGDDQPVPLEWPDVTVPDACYGFYTLLANESVSVQQSEQRVTGILSVFERWQQKPTHDIGIETFTIWTPQRRPNGQNLAVTITPAVTTFGPENVTNGLSRPTHAPNAWVAALDDSSPTLSLTWDTPQTIGRIELFFDTDYDHPMESALMGHPEDAMPFCVRDLQVTDASGIVVAELRDNYQTRRTLHLPAPITTTALRIHCQRVWDTRIPAALFEVRVYEK